MRTSPLTASTLLLLAAPAAAQSFNLDFGDPNSAAGIPASTFGAAAASPGMWNPISPSGAPMGNSGPLMDVNGTLTTVNIDFNSTTGTNYFNFSFDEPFTTGDAQALMDDIIWATAAHTLTINGLAAGPYVLYTYAMAPDSATGITTVNVPGSPDPLAMVGGDFSLGFMRNVTHAEHAITVAAGGSVVIEIDWTAWGDSLCGLQIVSGGPNGLGTNYCTANPNSTGSAAALSATGSVVALDNDVTLMADSLPNNAFGFFLCSQTQGFVMNPGGSQGNLCLAGAIGRYVGPNQIQNSGALGSISLVLNLAQTPQPTGFVAIAATQTWNFQAWFRDVSGGMATSNFTDGLSVTFQ